MSDRRKDGRTSHCILLIFSLSATTTKKAFIVSNYNSIFSLPFLCLPFCSVCSFWVDMLASITSWLTPTSLFILLNIMIGTVFLISRFAPAKTMRHNQQFGYDDDNSAPPLQRAPSLTDRLKWINFSTYKFSPPNQELDHHLQPEDNLNAHPLERAPSILERVKSIKLLSLYKYSPQNPDTDYIQPTEHDDYANPPQVPLNRAPSLLERVKSIDLISHYRSDSVKANQETEHPATEEADSETDMSTPVHGKVKRIKSESNKFKQRKLAEKMKKSASENSRRKVEEKAEAQEEEEEMERRRPATTRMEKTNWIEDGDQGVDAKADDFINKFKQQLKLQKLDSFLRNRETLKGYWANTN
ncbi:hypothetical protein REPUB_Repub18cG0109600 [Reevesia pubescens]